MSANKIILNGKTLIDLTVDTATEADVIAGTTFHKANGEASVGTWDGLSINGIIREYEVNAGASVSAGDFVEFVNKWGNINIFEDNSYVSNMSACRLNTNSVFIAYRYFDGSTYYLK